jgi:hypothetical protein
MNDLNDISLLILADLGCQPRRLKARIDSLCQSQQGVGHTLPPKPLRALEQRGWLILRGGHERKANYSIEVTDEGLAVHRSLMQHLRAFPVAAPAAVAA